MPEKYLFTLEYHDPDPDRGWMIREYATNELSIRIDFIALANYAEELGQALVESEWRIGKYKLSEYLKVQP